MSVASQLQSCAVPHPVCVTLVKRTYIIQHVILCMILLDQWCVSHCETSMSSASELWSCDVPRPHHVTSV